MNDGKLIRLGALAVAVAGACGNAVAASDVSNSGSSQKAVVTAIVSPIVSSQTTSLISGAISGAGFGGGISGGFTGGNLGAGGFAPGGSSGVPSGFGVQGGGTVPNTPAAPPGRNNTNYYDNPGQQNPRLEEALMGAGRRFALPGQGKETGIGGAPVAPKWNGYFAWARNSIGNDFAPIKNSGKVENVTLGVDYTFSNKLIVGLSATGSRADVDIQAVTGGKMEGRGTTYAPYVALPLNQNWSVDASYGFGRTKMTYKDTTQTANFNSDMSLFTVGTTYRRIIGERWMISGRASYMDVGSNIDAYTLTAANVLVPSNKVTLGQMRLGGLVAYNAGSVIPFAGLTYINDLSGTKIGTIQGQTAADDKDAWQASLGLRFATPMGVYGSVQYSTDKGRSQVKNDGVQMNLSLIHI